MRIAALDFQRTGVGVVSLRRERRTLIVDSYGYYETREAGSLGDDAVVPFSPEDLQAISDAFSLRSAVTAVTLPVRKSDITHVPKEISPEYRLSYARINGARTLHIGERDALVSTSNDHDTNVFLAGASRETCDDLRSYLQRGGISLNRICPPVLVWMNFLRYVNQPCGLLDDRSEYPTLLLPTQEKSKIDYVFDYTYDASRASAYSADGRSLSVSLAKLVDDLFVGNPIHKDLKTVYYYGTPQSANHVRFQGIFEERRISVEPFVFLQHISPPWLLAFATAFFIAERI